MVLLAAGLIALVTLALVAYPLVWRSRSPWLGETEGSGVGDLLGQRDALLRAIQQLDFELDLGNISPEEHLGLRSRYVRRAALVLREIDKWVRDLEEEIEREVAALLGGRSGLSEAGGKTRGQE